MTNTTTMLTVRNMHDSKNEAITFLFPSQSGWIRCSIKVVPIKLLEAWGVYNSKQDGRHRIICSLMCMCDRMEVQRGEGTGKTD